MENCAYKFCIGTNYSRLTLENNSCTSLLQIGADVICDIVKAGLHMQ